MTDGRAVDLSPLRTDRTAQALLLAVVVALLALAGLVVHDHVPGGGSTSAAAPAAAAAAEPDATAPLTVPGGTSSLADWVAFQNHTCAGADAGAAVTDDDATALAAIAVSRQRADVARFSIPLPIEHRAELAAWLQRGVQATALAVATAADPSMVAANQAAFTALATRMAATERRFGLTDCTTTST